MKLGGGNCWDLQDGRDIKIAVRVQYVCVLSLTQLRVGHTNSCNNVTKITDKS